MSMDRFVRLAAILVGLANALAFTVPLLFEGGPYRWLVLPLFAFAVTMVGLLASEILLRTMRRFLRGGFVSRYTAMVLGVFLGGVLTGLLLPTLEELLDALLSLVTYEQDSIASTILVRGGFFVVIGGVLGLVEGLIPALPLAALLERFGDREY